MRLSSLGICSVALASVLIIDAFWLLSVEFIRPSASAFPFASLVGAVISNDADQDRAAIVAKLGVFRGDLWAADAMLLAGGLGNNFYGAGVLPTEGFAPMRDAAAHAARLAPHDARVWLVLSVAAETFDASDSRLPALLKMSYYTAPNDPSLMRLRLFTAVRSGAIADTDLQVLVAAELRTIVQSRPDLKPAIEDAYRVAQAAGKEFMYDTLRNLDPPLAASLQAGEGGR
jgi:hypothetical protein